MRALLLASLLVASAPAAAQMSNSISGDLNAGYGGGTSSQATPGAIGGGAMMSSPGQVLPGTSTMGSGAGFDLTRQSPVPAGGNVAPTVTIDMGRGPVSGRGGDLTYGR